MPNRSFLQAFLDHRETDPRIRTVVNDDPMRNEVIIRMSTVMQGEIRISQRDLMGSREATLRLVSHGLEAFERRMVGNDDADIQDIARMRHEQELARQRGPTSSFTDRYLSVLYEDSPMFRGVDRVVDDRLRGFRIPSPPKKVEKPSRPRAVSLWERLNEDEPDETPAQVATPTGPRLYWAAVADDWELVA